jgi:hydroxymethylbilane synthase
MKKSITIGTRASKLAMIQTYAVVEQLQRAWPGLDLRVEQIRTRGDVNSEMPLTQIGSDGVFVTEIERALLEGRIDLAVHSLKDLPTAKPDGLYIVVVGPREDVRDVMVSGVGGQNGAQDFLAELSRISEPLRIGTCSLRRTAQIRRLCPDAQILPLRGNVDTRLRKLDAGDYDAIVLAAAGLNRLDLAAKLPGRVSFFPIETVMPAPGQGALALEMRDDPEIRARAAPLVNREAQAATSAERMFMRRLGAGCYLPVAAYGEVSRGTLKLQGLVISLDGRRHVRVRQSIRWTAQDGIEYAEQLGVSLAEEALARGADEIIRELARSEAHEPDARPADAVRSQAPDANVPDAHPPVAPPPDAHKGHPYMSAGHPTTPRDGGDMAIRGVGIGGKRILVTRAGEQAGALSERLRALGAVPIEFPMIHIVPPVDWQPFDEALRRLCAQGGQPEQQYYAWLVFTSANGVKCFFERLNEAGYADIAIGGMRVAVIGTSTETALAEYGIRAELVPDEFVAEELVAALVEYEEKRGERLAGKRVLLARAAEGRSTLVTRLREAGAIVDDVAVYRTLPVEGNDEAGREVVRMLQEGRIDMVTFTSSSTVRNFVRWLREGPGRPQGREGAPVQYTNRDGRESYRIALDRVTVACIGPVTAQTARELGLQVQIEAKESTIDGLIGAMLKYYEEGA